MMLSGLSRFPSSLVLVLFGLGAGCFAHAPSSQESPAEAPDLNDGLVERRIGFLMPPDRWEMLKRKECESNPTGGACRALFEVAANRLRWGVKTEDAPGLLVHACAQGYPLGCAAVDLLTMASVDNTEKLARLGCPEPHTGRLCQATSELLAYACNTRKQAPPCELLADLFASREPPDRGWTRRYLDRACAYGGYCVNELDVASREPTWTTE